MRSDFVRNLVIIFVGMLLVFMNTSTMPLLVRVVGVVFFVPAFISLANLFFARPGLTAAGVTFTTLINVGSMAFGLWLVLSPEVFMDLFLKLIAVALFLAAAYRIYYLYRLRADNAITWKMGVAPMLVAVVSAVLFAYPFKVASTLSLLLGLCAVFVGLTDIFLVLMLGNRRRGHRAGNSLP